MLRVIWELTDGPKSLAPVKARHVYRIVTIVKLVIETCIIIFVCKKSILWCGLKKYIEKY